MEEPSSEIAPNNSYLKEPVSIQQADAAIDQFLLDLQSDKSWEKCNSNDRVSVWRKMDDNTGIYAIKMIGRIPFPQEVVEAVLFVHSLRISWDKVLEDVKEIDELDGQAHLLHIITKAPPGVTYRDFVHLRRVRHNSKDKSKVVLDISTLSDKVPEHQDYIRAHTFCSGAILLSDLIPNMETKKLDEGTKYSMISQLDMRGYIPKTIVNWAVAYKSMDWFESLNQACLSYAKGELKLPSI